MRLLDQRRLRPERMDDPALDATLHLRALRGLERINRWSRTVHGLWRGLRRLADGRAPLRVLDLASGGGDLPSGLWHRARRAGVVLEIAGCDRSPRAVAYARQRR
ncbi:MAG: class I SAM-dependent methyltransferase [Planctomycetota bacterium]